MHVKYIVSAGALAIALGFAGGATAQTMIGGQTISEDDLERVKVYCEDLQNRENAADPGSTDDAAAEDTPTTPDDGTMDDGDDSDDTSTEEGTAGLVKLDEITLQQCIDAGLITE